MLKQVVNINTNKVAMKQFSTSSIALAGRQTGGRRKAEKKFDVDFMPKFDFDDQTTIGHNLFDNIREVRKYLRKTEFELPKLNGKLHLAMANIWHFLTDPLVFCVDCSLRQTFRSSHKGSNPQVQVAHLSWWRTSCWEKGCIKRQGCWFRIEWDRKAQVPIIERTQIQCEYRGTGYVKRKVPPSQAKQKVFDWYSAKADQGGKGKQMDGLHVCMWYWWGISGWQDTKDTFADIPLDLPKPKQRLEFPKEWIRSPTAQATTEAKIIEELAQPVSNEQKTA